MAHLISCQNLAKGFAAKELFSDLTFGMDSTDKLGIIGANGTGKSTLAKIMANLLEPDEGQVVRRKGLRLAYIAQVSAFDEEDLIVAAFQKHLHTALPHHEVAGALSQAGFADIDVPVSSLSGGWRKRLAIAAALAEQPDLLILDEPTNHLDIDGILWLESLLQQARFAWLCITHDRFFLDKVATKVAELSPIFDDGILVHQGGYQGFVAAKLAMMEQLEQETQSLANKVRRETDWLSRQPKARTTKARSRVQQAEQLQEDLQVLRQRRIQRPADFQFAETAKKGKKLIIADFVSKSFGDKVILDKFNFELHRGQKVAVVGPNGVGKSTLLHVLAQKTPAQGKITCAQDLKVVFFDQHREHLDPNATLKRLLTDGEEQVMVQGKPVHAITWARRFHFTLEQLDQPVGRLSGGEQARLLISILIRQPADVLILDEPTNDLDLVSIEILEQSLMEFSGAVLMVSHDRFLLERVCDSFVGLAAGGCWRSYASYRQWEQHHGGGNIGGTKKSAGKGDKSVAPVKPKKKKRLGYMEQREFDGLEATIEAAEGKVLELEEHIAAHPTDTATYQQLTDAQQEVERLYERWGELEQKQQELE